MPFTPITINKPRRCEESRVGYSFEMELSASPPDAWRQRFMSCEFTAERPPRIEGSKLFIPSVPTHDLAGLLDSIEKDIDRINEEMVKAGEEDDARVTDLKRKEDQHNEQVDAVLDAWWQKQAS